MTNNKAIAIGNLADRLSSLAVRMPRGVVAARLEGMALSLYLIAGAVNTGDMGAVASYTNDLASELRAFGDRCPAAVLERVRPLLSEILDAETVARFVLASNAVRS